MASFDVFNNAKFSMTNLTKWVNEMPFVPGLVGKLGIFGESEGVNTTSIGVENYGGTIVLVPNSTRGRDGTKMTRDTRKLRNFNIPRKAVSDEITADEIQNVRALGSDSDVEAVSQVVQRRQAKMLKSLDATVEYMRLGAVKGVIYDANGSTVIYNLFTEFSITQTEVDFVLGTTTTDILTKCMDVREAIQEALGAAGDDGLEVGMLCGKTFFKRLISHPKVAEAYKYYQTTQGQDQNPLQKDLRYKGFKFGDIWFYTYRGAVSGVNFVAASEAHAFPMNVPDVFIERYAPADYLETVNTEGLPRYSKVAPDQRFNRFVELEAQTNPIALCTRPSTLIKGTTSN